MTLDQFEQKLEKEKLLLERAQQTKDERWCHFWRILSQVEKSFPNQVTGLPITIHMGNNKSFFDASIIAYDENRVIWNFVGDDNKLLVFSLDTAKNFTLVLNNIVYNGTVVDINEKDDPKIPELLILTCKAGDVEFKVLI